MQRTNKIQICSICGSPILGYHYNAQPINNGTCCDLCHDRVVMPARMASASCTEYKMKKESETIQFTSQKYGGLTFEYIKEQRVLTDYKGIFIRNFPTEALDQAVPTFEEIFLNFSSLICDHENLKHKLERVQETDILEDLYFDCPEFDDESLEETDLSNFEFNL